MSVCSVCMCVWCVWCVRNFMYVVSGVRVVCMYVCGVFDELCLMRVLCVCVWAV
jgi:hypothetical protein